MENVCLGFYSYDNNIEILKEFNDISSVNMYTIQFKNSQDLASAYNLWPQTKFCLVDKETKKVISNNIIFFEDKLIKDTLIKMIQDYDEKYTSKDIIFWLNEKSITELRKILNICEKNRETYEKGKYL